MVKKCINVTIKTALSIERDPKFAYGSRCGRVIIGCYSKVGERKLSETGKKIITPDVDGMASIAGNELK